MLIAEQHKHSANNHDYAGNRPHMTNQRQTTMAQQQPPPIYDNYTNPAAGMYFDNIIRLWDCKGTQPASFEWLYKMLT